MRWIEFPDGSRYTFAVDVQKTAESYGYSVPCEADGTRHPGTDCNSKMRVVVKDIGMRRTFAINDQSVVDVKVDDGPVNTAFMQWLVDEQLISESYLRIGIIQLYSASAVDAILSVMLKAEVHYDTNHDPEYQVPVLVTKRAHNFEIKKNKPKISLFRK